LSQIIDVHEKNQILVISAFIRQRWFNPILAWDPAKYNNITEINVNPKVIWRPDIVLYNNADEDKSFGGNLDRLNTRAILKYTGECSWMAPIILKSQCPIDVKHFPFDTQFCTLKFGSWTYDKARLDLLSEADDVDLSKYSPNSEWQLNSARAVRNEVEYICCKGIKFPDVTYTIEISRRSLFYLCNLIFPMIIIGMLTMLSFLLPAESGERISLAITLLLAMTVFMLVVADIIPATSDVIPLVGIFFSASMVEMVVMIVVLCYMMRLHHKGPTDPPMSLWMRKFVLDWLSYQVRIRVKEDPNTSKTASQQFLALSKANQNKQPLLINNQQDISSKVLKSLKTNTEISWEETKTKVSLHTHNNRNGDLLYYNKNNFNQTKYTEAEMLLQKIDILIDKLHDMDEEDQVKTEWRIVAMTIDRILLVFFAIVFIVTLFGCFSSAPGYVP